MDEADQRPSPPAELPKGAGAARRVSVVVPAYNAERFVLEAIAGVRLQAYPDVEILLVDDGSKDRTTEVVAREAPEVRIIRQVNSGAAAARNAGLRMATGDFISFLDADDGWAPGKLAAQAAYLQAHPQVGAVYHDWTVLREDDAGRYPEVRWEVPDDPVRVDLEGSGWIYPRLLLECIVHTSTVMVRREVVRAVGEFEPGLATGEDYEYWLRVSRQCEIHKLAAKYSYYRHVRGGLTSAPREINNEFLVVHAALRKWGVTSPDGSTAAWRDVRRRLQELHFEFGYAHYHRGSRKIARKSFANALRHGPLSWRSLMYLLASTLPPDPRAQA